MQQDWVLSIKEQCLAKQIPFFFKQWGGVRKKRNGRTLQGKTFDEYPTQEHYPVLPSGLRLQYAAAAESATPFDVAVEAVT